MRGTLHALAAGDVHWLVTLFGPRFITKYRSSRLALGLTDTHLERAIDALPSVLRSSGPITRAGLAQRLSDAGINVSLKGQASAHLVVAASLRGILCCGPDTTEGKATYALLDEWIAPPTRRPKDPLAELATRYLEGYGPASASDFAGWSGLKATEARDAIERVADNFEETQVHGERAWFRATPASDADVVRLVGGFDAYLLAYKRREFALDRKHSARVQPGGGIIHPLILVNGRVEGTWRLRNGRVAVEVFGDKRHALAQEVGDVQRFVSTTIAANLRCD